MRIAVFGTGLMGSAMSERLLQLGHTVSVYNRSPEKTQPLEAAGAVALAEPADAFAQAEVAILMLPDKSAIDCVLFPKAARSPEFKSGTMIQMGTIAPQESRDLQERIVGFGGTYLEAPVLGSTSEAADGTLSVMVGGEPAQFRRWTPLFKCFGEEPLYVGPVGKAAALKLALNQLIASLTAAYAYSIGLVLRHGIDPQQFADLLRKGPLYAAQFDKKLPHMLGRNFSQPRFSLGHMLKDVRLILGEGDRIGLNTSMISGVEQLLCKALDYVGAEVDYCALYTAVNPAESPDSP